VLSDVGCHYFAMLRSRVVQDPLNKIVSVLVTRNVDKGDASAVKTPFADTIEIPTKKVAATNLQTLLNHL
jgi:hypothetical protein